MPQTKQMDNTLRTKTRFRQGRETIQQTQTI